MKGAKASGSVPVRPTAESVSARTELAPPVHRGGTVLVSDALQQLTPHQVQYDELLPQSLAPCKPDSPSS